MRVLLAIAIVLTLSLAVSAQHMTFGGGTDGLDRRESTWIAYFDQPGGRFVGGFTINYNKVVWQERYAEELDTILRGSIWRMGKHFWSTLDTNLGLELAGVRIPAGYYYLGLSRDEEGTFHLAVIDAQNAQKARLDAFNIADADVRYSVPLTLEQTDSVEDALTIFFSVERKDPSVPYEAGIVTDALLTIAFGDVRLKAPVKVDTPT